MIERSGEGNHPETGQVAGSSGENAPHDEEIGYAWTASLVDLTMLVMEPEVSLPMGSSTSRRGMVIGCGAGRGFSKSYLSMREWPSCNQTAMKVINKFQQVFTGLTIDFSTLNGRLRSFSKI